jgi:hypothetical protein
VAGYRQAPGYNLINPMPNPPFIPPTFLDTKPKGGWTHISQGGNAPMDDGPGPFLNPPNTGAPVRYNGQTQTAVIATANPKPPTQTLPAKANPIHSQIPSP